MAAALAVYQACFVAPRLSAGETGYVLVLAASRDQAHVVHDYIRAFLEISPVLRQEIASTTASEIRLRSGVIIAVHANSFRSVWRTLLAAIFDEVAFWRDKNSASPDLEVYRAVLPALMTTRGMLFGISTPYRRLGLLNQKHRDQFGVDGDDVLVLQGPSTAFNPQLSQEQIDAAVTEDPEAARQSGRLPSGATSQPSSTTRQSIALSTTTGHLSWCADTTAEADIERSLIRAAGVTMPLHCASDTAWATVSSRSLFATSSARRVRRSTRRRWSRHTPRR